MKSHHSLSFPRTNSESTASIKKKLKDEETSSTHKTLKNIIKTKRITKQKASSSPPLPQPLYLSFIFFLSLFSSLYLSSHFPPLLFTTDSPPYISKKQNPITTPLRKRRKQKKEEKKREIILKEDMVFSSIPVYSDHPNWHQVQQGSLNENSQLQQPPPLQVGGGSGGSGGGSSIRPGSMVDRARLAKVPQPEAGLNCPRCDSTNTKFCYFNNYSLTQPRHFCKACRRYWTRGGALRNVPVGGGYRKNKRSKSNSSNNSSKSQASTGAKSTSVSPSPSSCSHFPQPSPQFSFMATLQGLGQYGGGNVDSNIAGFQAQMAAGGGDLGFQMGNNSSGISSNLLVGGVEQWRLPFLGGLDHQQPTNYQTPVKMEESHGLNFSWQFIGGGLENNQYWSGNQWAEFSGVNSSSTSQLL